jgi:hypothetical protein
MLDDTPRQTPSDPAANPIEADTARAPEAPTLEPPVTSAPAASDGAVSATALMRADISNAWAGLDQSARLLVSASVAAFVVVLIGLPLSVWDSAPFALLVLAAGTITTVTGWFGASPAFRDLPIPRATIELMATAVVAALAVLKLLEVLFDLDADGIVGLVVAAALVASAGALLVAARRRTADPIGSLMRGDRGSSIAAIGLVLVLIGWALNLSISFWSMGGAALPLAVMTLAALTVTEAPRIQSPVPVAWIGAGIAVFGALLALGHWGELTTLGRTEIELEPFDFLGLVVWSVGIALVIAGGVMSGRSQWTPSAAAVVEPKDGTADPT